MRAASLAQGGSLHYNAPEDATFYRMDSGAAQGGAPNYSGMLAGYHAPPSDPNHHMMELLGLLRAVRHSAWSLDCHRDIPLGCGLSESAREPRATA